MSLLDKQFAEAALMQAGNPMPGRQSRRGQLEYQKNMLELQLDNVNKALAALDAHPELEEFIETLARAGA